MNEPLTHTFNVVVEKDVTDLEMCLLILRNVANRYPRHFDIALEALRAEANLPPIQSVIRESNQ